MYQKTIASKLRKSCMFHNCEAYQIQVTGKNAIPLPESLHSHALQELAQSRFPVCWDSNLDFSWILLRCGKLFQIGRSAEFFLSRGSAQCMRFIDEFCSNSASLRIMPTITRDQTSKRQPQRAIEKRITVANGGQLVAPYVS